MNCVPQAKTSASRTNATEAATTVLRKAMQAATVLMLVVVRASISKPLRALAPRWYCLLRDA